MGMLTVLLACNGSPADVPGPSDADGDGFVATADCDDARASVHPGAAEVPDDGIDQDCDGVDPLPEVTLVGEAADEGFGTRVAVAGRDVIVSAPFATSGGGLAAGRVLAGGVSYTSVPGAFFGAGLGVLADGTALVGSPGIGRLANMDGVALLVGPGVGGVIATRGDAWVTSTPVGAMREAGVSTTWDRRPDALALDAEGAVWGGFARGEAAIRVGEQAVGRAATGDEAGYAILLADVDGDGAEELVVGAPGAGVVYILDTTALPASLAEATPIGPGTGRFGAALAFGDGTLYVGAPMAGGGVQGAVYAVKGGTTLVAAGESPGDQLGAALAFAHGSLVIGAPGAADAAGYVRVMIP